MALIQSWDSDLCISSSNTELTRHNKNVPYIRLSQVYESFRKKAIKIFFKLKIKSLTFYITISAYSHYISAYFIQVHMAMKVRRE